MALWFDVMRFAAGFNVLLLLGLSAIWIQNYRQFRSKHALGLLVFALLLLAENASAVYIFTMHPTLSGWFHDEMVGTAQIAMTALRLLMTAGLLFLAWVTWD